MFYLNFDFTLHTGYPLYPNIVVVEHENWVNITICLDDLDVYSSEVEFLNQTSYKRFDIGWKCAVYNFTVSLSGIETYAVSAIVSTTDNITYVFKDKVFKRSRCISMKHGVNILLSPISFITTRCYLYGYSRCSK